MFFKKKKNKIFCIGNNKTGTTSLFKFFKDHNYKVANQNEGERLLDKYINRDFRPIIKYCKKYDVFQDLPFSNHYLYVILDQIFPNSKFILSVRNSPEQWYNSITKYHTKIFSPNENTPSKEILENAMYLDKGWMWRNIKEKYSTHSNFDEDIYNKEEMIKYYVNYNHLARNYFKNSPNFLEINIAEKNSINALSNFLEIKPLYKSFPHEHKTENISNKVESYREKLKQKIHFLHIGKTGGSNLKNTLSNIEDERFDFILHSHKITLEDIPLGEKVIFCVRDPLKRYISGFYSRLRKGQPLYYYEWSEAEKNVFTKTEDPNELAKMLYSEDNKSRKFAETSINSITHTKSSYWDWFKNKEELLKRKNDILFVFNTNTLNEDFKEFKELLNLNKELELSSSPKLMHANPKQYSYFLDESSKLNLTKWYSKEFEFLETLDEIGINKLSNLKK